LIELLRGLRKLTDQPISQSEIFNVARIAVNTASAPSMTDRLMISVTGSC